jgi:hypothetical protein
MQILSLGSGARSLTLCATMLKSSRNLRKLLLQIAPAHVNYFYASTLQRFDALTPFVLFA